jgi:hypothetical protein
MIFNALQKLVPSESKPRRFSISQRVNHFLTKLMTGNKSGALLLTTFVLMLGAAVYQNPRGKRRPGCDRPSRSAKPAGKAQRQSPDGLHFTAYSKGTRKV